MSMLNLASALHEELCEVMRCREQIPGLVVGDQKIAQFYHRVNREFWEGMARRTVDTYTTNILRNRRKGAAA